MATIEEIQKEIVAEFEGIGDDWMDKYNYIIELGKSLPPLDEKYRLPENLIQGCQSQVWLGVAYENGKLFFFADSDAIITKGMIALLLRVLSGQSPNDIYEADLWFVEKIGLSSHLSPTRSNGLLSMIKQIKMYALAYKTKYNV